jgi:hypothetical protein
MIERKCKDEYKKIDHDDDGIEVYKVEGILTFKYIKATESDVTNPIDIEDYPRLEDFMDEWF